MKKNIYILAMIALFCGLVLSCGDDNEFPQKQTTIAPDSFTDDDISWKPISGGAIIRYQTPEAPNIRGVEVRYQLETGQEVVKRGSFLSDSLIVEGFLTETEKSIELFVIDNSENYSTPYALKITPNPSSITGIAGSLKVIPDFGGMQITFDNVDENAIAAFIYKVNEKDTILIQQEYTDQKKVLLTVRGQEAVPSEYIVQFRDRWSNYSSMLSHKLTPLFEKQIENFDYFPDDYFGGITNPGDMHTWFNGGKITADWSGQFWPRDNSESPHWSAISLDNPTTLSRIVLWQYGWGANNYEQLYAGQNARKVEIYGSLEETPLHGDPATTDTWELIMMCEIKMPSGQHVNSNGSMTDEDFDVARNKGHEFVIPLVDPIPQYRALAFKVVESFRGSGSGLLSEVEIFGDDRPEGEK